MYLEEKKKKKKTKGMTEASASVSLLLAAGTLGMDEKFSYTCVI